MTLLTMIEVKGKAGLKSKQEDFLREAGAFFLYKPTRVVGTHIVLWESDNLCACALPDKERGGYKWRVGIIANGSPTFFRGEPFVATLGEAIDIWFRHLHKEAYA